MLTSISGRETITLEDKKLYKWLESAAQKTLTRPVFTWAITGDYLDYTYVSSTDGYRMHVDIGDYPQDAKIEFKKSIDCDSRPPDFMGAVPRKNVHKFIVDSAEMLKALKMFKIKRMGFLSIHLTFKHELLTIHGDNGDDINITHVMPLKQQNWPDFEFTVDPRYLYDAIKGFTGDVRLHFSHPTAPMLVGELDTRYAVVMPMQKARSS